MSARKIKTLARDGRDAFENVTDHFKIMVDHLGQDASDAVSVSAVALGHAAIELVGDVQAKLDRLEMAAERQIRRHPGQALAGSAAGVALIAVAAGLVTYAVTRRPRDA
ncbi:hypothetical protein ASD21_12515 [Caulobacter sp. Root1455]|jgi:hypothetical protein|uniref:hypothetical protein n=1 Tax=unclassified Caulobacter TaxID=2648921 RepID=UPI0007013507|nr:MULTISPECIES: hypothetical protein [unclassified Caulobacter]KQY29947.1 hypothetical protein ASD38_11580 [Caulobacter sp. Root487D2Y]KQY92246.1 hypothetical protein ASD21_12515 [Caulobacter sp. Root1455]